MKLRTGWEYSQMTEIIKKYLALDIGGSAIKCAVMDDAANILSRNTCDVPRDNDDFVAVICRLFRECEEEVGGLAISMPGVIDSEQGVAISGGAFKFIDNLPLVSLLTEELQVPVWIGNDAKCAAFAEIGFGNLADVNDAFVVILGTGIGGCLIKDRKVHYGHHFAAGEFSSLIVSNTDPYTDTGRWWGVNGIAGLLATTRKHLGEDADLTGKQIFEMANAGDEKILAAITEFSRNIAIQIYNIQTIMDVPKIAIGGGISAQPILIDKICESFDEIINCGVIAPVVRPDIVACKYLNDANLVGALYQLLQIGKTA